MGFLALAVLIVIGVAVAVGLHTGPHGLVVTGGAGIAASVALVFGVITMAPAGTRTSVALALLSTAGFISVVALLAGALAFPALSRRQLAVGAGRTTTLWGADGVAVTDLAPVGTARVHGEIWTAESVSGEVRAGTPVHVLEVNGLRLRVCADEAVEEGDQTWQP